MLRGLAVFLFILAIADPTSGLNPRKLDENTVPSDSGNKCGGCSACNNPCYQSPPPPPPPPSLPPPPPPPKKPPTPSLYCPPPPPSSFIYISGPPGNLYPVDPYFSGAGRSFSSGLPLLIGGGLLGLLALW
ncbi:unnamed protein product [Ilex paraguariensis]|uniref:Uncharacterized protein n=1 Tax=Ilex paraguariensis TaxID=185542 RepID=A0ABC8SJL2_9AQUA